MVGERGEELVQQVAMGAVNLHTIVTGGLGTHGGGDEGDLDGLDLADRERTGRTLAKVALTRGDAVGGKRHRTRMVQLREDLDAR